MTKLFSAPIKNITFKDIENFCLEEIPENLSLDYKENLSSTKVNEQVAKITCALANTYGGVVLWGIEEKKLADGRGVPKGIPGMDALPSPADRLKKICMDSIYPPLFPEVQDIVHETDKSKVLTIMRVPESDHTPHYLRSDGCVYIRGDDISKPLNDGRVATPDEIEWLQERRRRPTELRDELLKLAEERCLFLADTNNSMSVSMIPLYPRMPLIGLQELDQLHWQAGGDVQRQSAQHSVFSMYWADKALTDKSWKYFELNEFGLLYCASKAGEFTKAPNSINTIALLQRLIAITEFARQIYVDLNYWGLLQIEAKIRGVRGYQLISSSFTVPELGRQIVDDKVILRTIIPAAELTNSDWIKDLHQRFLWALGRGGGMFTTKEVDTDFKYTKEQYPNDRKCLIYTL